MWEFIFVHDQESRRPENQLWSSFLTLLSSLSWALVRAGASDSADLPLATVCLGVDCISSSESSSSFSLSSSSSACSFSSLRPRDHMKEEKKPTWLFKSSDKHVGMRKWKPSKAWIPAVLWLCWNSTAWQWLWYWPGVCDRDEQRLDEHWTEEGGGGQDVGWRLQKLTPKKKKQKSCN